ncbi:MAG TPA: type II/IV secretion system protein, partial [Pirellulaceae bacterium]|nr:type II/IV secretion system protein [Pirellulaceae bacterium]
MAARSRDFTEVLVRQGVLSVDQVNEAKRVAQEKGQKLPDTVVKLGYAAGDEVMQALAGIYGYPYIDLREISIPESVIELVPESVARENTI